MSKAMTEKVEQIFASALEIEAKEDLKAFLDRACQGDERVRAEVEDMLVLRPQIDKMFPEGGVVFTLTDDFIKPSQSLE
jgi:pantothenate synthetase